MKTSSKVLFYTSVAFGIISICAMPFPQLKTIQPTVIALQYIFLFWRATKL